MKLAILKAPSMLIQLFLLFWVTGTIMGQKMPTCYVCSSDPKVGSPLYHKDCLKSPGKLPPENILSCDKYDDFIRKTFPDNSYEASCPTYSICRSQYYEHSNSDMKYEFSDGSSEKPYTGDREKAFRFCGCVLGSTLAETKDKQADLAKKIGGKSKCHDDILAGVRRTRRCACRPEDDKPCNTASKLAKISFPVFVIPLLYVLLPIQ